MSRTGTGRAASFDVALANAIADLLDVDADQVELGLRAPGVEELRGGVELRLSVARDGARSEEASKESPAAADEAAADEPARSSERDDAPIVAVTVTPEELDEEADAAADFLEGLLDALDLPGDLRITVQDDHAEIEIVDIGSGALIGRRGQTLEAIQELVRCTLQRQFQRRSRIKIDAEGYRARRLEKLVEKAEEAIDAALDTGEPQRLEPMDVFERKTVHRMVAEVEGLVSRSQGREPARRVVIELE